MLYAPLNYGGYGHKDISNMQGIEKLKKFSPIIEGMILLDF